MASDSELLRGQPLCNVIKSLRDGLMLIFGLHTGVPFALFFEKAKNTPSQVSLRITRKPDELRK